MHKQARTILQAVWADDHFCGVPGYPGIGTNYQCSTYIYI